MKKRSRVQELFCSNKIRVVYASSVFLFYKLYYVGQVSNFVFSALRKVVATVAFGMGLDKSDVEGV